MFAKTIIVVSAAIILATTLQVVAKDDGVPTIDLEKRCRESQRTTEKMVGNPLPGAFEVCMRTERAARELLVKVWETVPESVKAQCAQPRAYSPSYVEWVTCGEMERDVRKLRKEQPVSAQTDKLCPIVLFEQDGSITSVNACPVPTRLLY
jgi:hypothetical protein